MRSLSGRKRRLPRALDRADTPERAEALRQAINSPVQSFANELNLMVLLQMTKEFPDVFRPVMTVHDAIGAEVKNSHVKQVKARMEEVMQAPALLKELLREPLIVPICGEVKLGPWGLGK